MVSDILALLGCSAGLLCQISCIRGRALNRKQATGQACYEIARSKERFRRIRKSKYKVPMIRVTTYIGKKDIEFACLIGLMTLKTV